jgi:hypothetical protein
MEPGFMSRINLSYFPFDDNETSVLGCNYTMLKDPAISFGERALRSDTFSCIKVKNN